MLLSLLTLVEDVRFAGAIHAEPADSSATYTIFLREQAAGAGVTNAKGKPANRDALRQTQAGRPPIAALSEVILAFLSNNIRLALEVIFCSRGFMDSLCGSLG